MQPHEILEKLKNHPKVMYRDLTDEDEKGLRTGDIVKLEIEDFEAILKSFPLLKPLLESYQNNHKYKSNLWCILNKPCDMVHAGTQKFKSSSLFLAPLQSFLGELKKDRIFSDYVSLSTGTVPEVKEALYSIYDNFIKKIANEKHPMNEDATPQEKAIAGKARTAFVTPQRKWVREEVFENFNGTETLEMIEQAFDLYGKEFQESDNPTFKEFIGNFSSNADWIKYKKDYMEQVKSNNEIRINSEKLNDLTSTVFYNQMDIRGRFYFEPHQDIYCEVVSDFSYIIELEDLLTFKLNDEVIRSGSLVKLLQDKRKVGLKRNYSDRLQNIMGYYYSKIGTQDVKGKDVLGLYDDCFDHFFVDKSKL